MVFLGPASDEFWNGYFAGMARDRFNRLEMVFESVPGPAALPALRSIAQTAAQYGVDLAIGFVAPDTTEIERLLASCPSVRAVVLHGTVIPDTPALLQLLSGAGHRVVLELPDNESTVGLIEEAGRQGAPLRLFATFTGEASNPQPRDSYWAMDPALGTETVNTISGAGFEIAGPLDEQRRPEIDSIADWGRSGYDRPLPTEICSGEAPRLLGHGKRPGRRQRCFSVVPQPGPDRRRSQVLALPGDRECVQRSSPPPEAVVNWTRVRIPGRSGARSRASPGARGTQASGDAGLERGGCAARY